MTILNGVKLRGDETFTELLKIGKKKIRPKKDNSKKGDILLIVGVVMNILKVIGVLVLMVDTVKIVYEIL